MDVNLVVVAIGYKLDSAFSSIFSHLPLKQPRSERLYPDRRWVASGLLSGNSRVGKLAREREFGPRAAGHPVKGRLWLVGDALTGPSSVVSSMAEGRLAARAILEKQN